VHHQFEFPQPPFVLTEPLPSNFYVTSNPATIVVNGVSFGVCASDILKHIQQNGRYDSL
jgi:hypothetical protein